MLFSRDHHISGYPEIESQFYSNPIKAMVKWHIRFLGYLLFQISPSFYNKKYQSLLQKKKKHARQLTSDEAKFYLSNKPYFQIQIGTDTRNVLFVPEGECQTFHVTPQKGEKLFLGMAPLIDKLEQSRVKTWRVTVKVICQKTGEVGNHEVCLPYGARNDNFVYSADDGWIDTCLSLEKFADNPCEISFCFQLTTTQRLSLSPKLSISCPQLIKHRKTNEVRNIFLVSIESLTNLDFLKNKYGLPDLPNFSRILSGATNYSHAYSTAESTLPFAGSLFTGLLPSQHGIGNYAVPADSFSNKIYNFRHDSLVKFLKSKKFLTFGGTVDARFSPKVGWARWFDHYCHVMLKWRDPIPDLDWVRRVLHEYREYDKFIYLHLEGLHEPLLTFKHQNQSMLCPMSVLDDASPTQTLEIFYYQLKRIDFQLGSLLDYLEKSGQIDQSALVLTGDHGCGLSWVKHSEYALYEERIHVPLVVKYPKWTVSRCGDTGFVNSITEIYRTVWGLFGEPLPATLLNLPQYRLPNHAFAETIMNPNKEYRKHNLAIMHMPYKYVCWNKIDWDAFHVDSFGKEVLYKWDEIKNSFDETMDIVEKEPRIAAKYKSLARDTILQNLNFLSQYPPQSF